MRILVQKFGGSSVANLECMQQVQKRVISAVEQGYKVVVVLSAMKGETNRLIDLAQEWSETPDPAELDTLLVTGEQTSVALFAMLLHDSKIKARSVLGFQMPMRTDASYGSARILGIESNNILAMLQKYDVLVTAGFQGCTNAMRVTTLGRGGSDTSAVAIAAVLGAECEIYTDVDGVYTTDPNICSKARKIDRISYDEMLEMASMGAKVLQIRSVEFAKKYKVAVHVRSTFSDDPGTVLTQEDKMESALVSGIAYDKDQSRITLRAAPDKPGVAASLFCPLADAGIIVDMIVQNPGLDGVTDMTFTVPRKDLKKSLEIVQHTCDTIGASGVLYDEHVCKVSAIGVGMRNHSGVASIAFSSLLRENINIKMISTSEIKVTCLIDEKYTELAVRTLHEAFGLDDEPNSIQIESF